MKLPLLGAIAASVAACCTVAAAPAVAAPAYGVTRTVPLGAPDRWDYVVFDPSSARVFVAHGDRVTAVDAASGAIVGQIEGMPGGTHGVAFSPATGRGVTDDGRAGQAVLFDLKTLKVVQRLPAAEDADAIAAEGSTGRFFVINGDTGTVTVVDPKAAAVVATIPVGEKLESGASDDRGTLFIAGAGARDLVRIDARAAKLVSRSPTPDCESPHGLAMDKVGRRLFMGCINAKLMVLDADTGRVVTELPIGQGSDAVAWDPTRRRVFSSNGRDGTITVYQQASPDRYTAMEPVTTAVSGRTMSVDPATGRLFVVAADIDPAAAPGPGGRPRFRPGSLKLLMLDPVAAP